MKNIKRSRRSGERVRHRYFSRGEVAQLFEVSPATVARWAREGKLPHVSTLGGHRRYRADEILAIVEKAFRSRWSDSIRRREA